MKINLGLANRTLPPAKQVVFQVEINQDTYLTILRIFNQATSDSCHNKKSVVEIYIF